MTFSVLEPDPSTYHLWRRFTMPTKGGPRDAIAVPADVANNLTSAYTFLVSMIVIDTWVLLLLFLLWWDIRRNQKRGTATTTVTAIWNAKASPSDVVKLTALHFRTHRRWSILLWMTLALFCLLAHYAIPIVVAPYIVLDNAAPVAADKIYVPYPSISATAISTLKGFYLQAPSAFRAVGNVQTVMSSKHPRVSVDNPVVLQDLGDGEAIMRVDYRYDVSGVDFGLQHYPGLVLNVEGSCTTEYGWLFASSTSDGNVLDTYILWPDNLDYATERNVSLFDGPMPQGFLLQGYPSPTGPPGNSTWAAVVSSLQRMSATEGTDPWYLTTPSEFEGGPINRVKEGRPALSCWQNDVWSYKGHNSTVIELNSEMLPGLDLSEGLQNIIVNTLDQPRIVTLATQLGPQALASTTTSLGQFFDAEESSLFRDIQRLVIASYVATTNALTESTLFAEDRLGISNIIIGNNSQVMPGTDDFVIWSSRVRTLSVRTIIIIPVIALVLFIAVICMVIIRPPMEWEVEHQPAASVKEPDDIEKGQVESPEREPNGVQDTYSQIKPAPASPPSRPKMDAKHLSMSTVKSIASALSDDADSSAQQMIMPQ